MKKIVFFLFFLTVSFLTKAQNDSGTSFGVGLGTFSYYTNLYYYRFDNNPSRYNYPEHKLNRFMLIVNGEREGLWRAGQFRFDGAAEVLIGLGGKSTGLWLPQEETISKGGFAFGLGGYVKAGYPVKAGSTRLFPFLGLGPQFTTIHNNGKGLGENFASNDYYFYGEGWTEFILLFAGSVGCSFSVADFEIIPEFRFGITGASFTNWEPNEEGVQMESSPGLLGFSVKVNKKF